jgi:hypothetical protein
MYIMEYDKDFIFKKLKPREENRRERRGSLIVLPKKKEEEKVIIGEPIKIELEVIDLGKIE